MYKSNSWTHFVQKTIHLKTDVLTLAYNTAKTMQNLDKSNELFHYDGFKTKDTHQPPMQGFTSLKVGWEREKIPPTWSS